MRARISTNVHDVLSNDGGWWTINGMAMRLGRRRDSVARAIHRMDNRGLLDGRSRGIEKEYRLREREGGTNAPV
jgi:DNA-binding transcriptional regulator PaaX